MSRERTVVASRCGNEDRLQRRDRPSLRRGDPLLQFAHLVGERWLVPHRRRHPAEQRRHLGTGLREPEDVVDEQQHVFSFDVAEILGHRERRETDPETHARRFVHLTEHQRGVLDDARLGHLEEQVVPLTRPLADARENGDAAVLLRLPADHLLDDHRLSHACAAEHPDLAALHVELEQVDDLDAGLQNLLLRLEVLERRRVPVDRPPVGRLDARGFGVQWLTEHVVHVPEHALADGHGDGTARVRDRCSADEPVGRPERDRAHDSIADVLRDLARDRLGLVAERHVDRERGVDLWEPVRRELDVHHRADHAHDPSFRPFLVSHRSRSCSASRHSLVACASASAPPTISMISVVISSWRARFAWRVRTLMSSSALSVAAAIARRRAAFSEAADSSSAAYTFVTTYCGSRWSRICSGSGSNRYSGWTTPRPVPVTSSGAIGRNRWAVARSVNAERKSV